jgi:hypothetical protein
MNYEQKYLKYKQKYLDLKEQIGGVLIQITSNIAHDIVTLLNNVRSGANTQQLITLANPTNDPSINITNIQQFITSFNLDAPGRALLANAFSNPAITSDNVIFSITNSANARSHFP